MGITNPKLLRILGMAICLNLFLPFSFGQDVAVPENFAAKKIKGKISRDPQALAKALTIDLNSDKEKFDAIFAWVVTNIEYDYRTFNSGRGISSQKLKKILRKRRGVCTDYARLMDSLCYYSGLTSTSINGYIKNITFDVNDSLYFDNHTWNAVKLDQFWYLYDATWSSGSNVYDLTRLGKWRRKKLSQLLEHAVLEKREFKIRKKKNKLCGLPGGIVLKSTDEWNLPFPYGLLYRLIDFFPYRLKVKYVQLHSSNYYLTHPDVFVLDHFPNDPMWAMTTSIRNLDDFRKDSTYYYGIDDQFSNQKREGRSCIACDDYLSLDDMAEAKELIARSKRDLPHNPFVPASAAMTAAQLYLKDYLKEKDSLMKLQLYDSTLYYIKLSRNDFNACRKPASRENNYHNKKNAAKRAVLLKENKDKQVMYNKLFKAVQLRHQKMRSLEPKLKSFESRVRNSRNRFVRSFGNPSAAIKKEEKLKSLRSDLQRSLFRADSLTNIIVMHREKLLLQTTELWRSLLVHNQTLVPLQQLYFSDSYWRSSASLDSYDFEIRMLRKRIDSLERNFHSRVQVEILDRADSVFYSLKQLHSTVHKRNDYLLRSAKMMSTLVISSPQDSLYNRNVLIDFRSGSLKKMREDICWNEDHRELFAASGGTFKNFYRRSRYFKVMISKNTAHEQKRYTKIQKHIATTRNRVMDACTSNILTLRKMRGVISH
jgi:hypothetical protein